MADERARRIIAALEVSLDGLIEGPDGEVDWIGSWEDSFGLLPEIDTLVLGGGAYPGYEQYWLGILANPQGVQPLTGKVPSQSEVAYARFADTTPHLVLSRTLDTVAWKTTRIVRDVADIGALKQQPGKAIHAVGGASAGLHAHERGAGGSASADRPPGCPWEGQGPLQGCRAPAWARAARDQASGGREGVSLTYNVP